MSKAVFLAHFEDFIIVADSKEECVRLSCLVKGVFSRKLIFFYQCGQFQIGLYQKFTWLGAFWCSRTSLLYFSADKDVAYIQLGIKAYIVDFVLTSLGFVI